MAKGKERAEAPAKATKTAKSAGPRTPGSRPAAARNSAPVAPDAPTSDVAETRVPASGNARTELSPEDVYRLIQETAYFKAKARGFEPGGEVQDWIEAEAEVRRRLENRA